jgi:membrane-associated phospholipid phosphatase
MSSASRYAALDAVSPDGAPGGDSDDSLPWSALLRKDSLDLALVIVCFVLGLATERSEPFHQFIQLSDLQNYAYPLKPNTVPSGAVLPLATLLPCAVFAALLAQRLINRRQAAKLLLGLLASCALTLALTNVTKLTVGRPRPSFLARCFGTTNVTAVLETGTSGLPGFPLCTTSSAASIKEGRKSFPSGHASLSAAGLVYLFLVLLRIARPNGPPSSPGGVPNRLEDGAFSRLLIAISPLLLLGFVAVTRFRDYWHHSTDIAAALLLGGVVARACLQRVAPIAHHHGGRVSAGRAPEDPRGEGGEPYAHAEP